MPMKVTGMKVRPARRLICMKKTAKKDTVKIPPGSTLEQKDYKKFLSMAASRINPFNIYFAPSEGKKSLELAHIIPEIPETLIAIYVGINDAVCNKGLLTPFLVNHGHDHVFAFDPNFYEGKENVPDGTVDVKTTIRGWQRPNNTWSKDWTYVMIQDPSRTPESLWKEDGYIDTVVAKLEDFTLLTDDSKIIFYIDPKAFDHPVNQARDYLKKAIKRGMKVRDEFIIPNGLEDEVADLVPVLLKPGEKLYVATIDGTPCAHSWNNLHPDNKRYAVVNENSAPAIRIVTQKPPASPRYGDIVPAFGSADMTTDRFKQGTRIYRKPLLVGSVKG